MSLKIDQLNRYLFQDLHARGELVQVSDTLAQMMKNHQYPTAVKQQLAELLVATCLLTATLKIKGEITVQVQGDGPLSYMAINGNHQQQMRGIARAEPNTQAEGLKALVGNARMVITIRPEQGEAYQGIVALEHDTLAQCLAHYFDVSEQIPTHIWLFTDVENNQAAGALVQLLPDSGDKQAQIHDYEHLCQLTNTLTAKELFSLPASELLHRLYHEETVQLFEPQTISFVCGCSEDKCLNAISQLGKAEIEKILSESGKIEITCEYCLTNYQFDQHKLQPLLQQKPH